MPKHWIKYFTGNMFVYQYDLHKGMYAAEDIAMFRKYGKLAKNGHGHLFQKQTGLLDKNNNPIYNYYFVPTQKHSNC